MGCWKYLHGSIFVFTIMAFRILRFHFLPIRTISLYLWKKNDATVFLLKKKSNACPGISTRCKESGFEGESVVRWYWEISIFDSKFLCLSRFDTCITMTYGINLSHWVTISNIERLTNWLLILEISLWYFVPKLMWFFNILSNTLFIPHNKPLWILYIDFDFAMHYRLVI